MFNTAFHRLLVVAACLLSPVVRAEDLRPFYAALNSSEATLRFAYFVESDIPVLEDSSTLRQKVEKQVAHLFGSMARGSYPGVPKGNHQIKIKDVSKDEQTGRYLAHYSYEGTVILKDGAPLIYQLVLPRNPDRIYDQAIVMNGAEKTYPCTDRTYSSRDYFWYFWSPDRPGCQLKQGQDFDVIPAMVELQSRTVTTYPEYERLVDSKGEIPIHVLLTMENESNSPDPLTSKDFNAENFRKMREGLLAAGYQETVWSAMKVAGLISPPYLKLPYVASFTKKEKKATLVVRLFFGPIGSYSRRPFDFFFKDALSKAAVMMYGGHSGLGEILDLDVIERREMITLTPATDRYQIYFFNSCSSYPYYNQMFFDRKKTDRDPRGRKNLDLLASGLSTYFNTMARTNLELIKAIETWAAGGQAISYQELLKNVDTDNLLGVNGDEDNPTTTSSGSTTTTGSTDPGTAPRAIQR